MADTLRDQLTSFYQETLRTYATYEAEVESIERLMQGWETEIYHFRLGYEVQGEKRSGDYILRLYPSNDAIPKSTREFNYLQKLHHLGYPVPEVFYHVTSPVWVGKPFIIMANIAGDTLAGRLETGDAVRRIEWQQRFVQLLADLHMLDYKPFLEMETIPYDLDDPLGFPSAVIRHWRTMMSQFGIEGEMGPFIPVLAWLEAHATEIETAMPSVVHGDFHIFNILVTPHDEAYVIDWGNAGIGDLRSDVAWTLLLASTYQQDTAAPIRQAYEHLSGNPLPQLAYFEVIAALRRLGTAAMSLILGAKAMGMREDTTETIRTQRDHFQKVYALLQARSGAAFPEIGEWLNRAF